MTNMRPVRRRTLSRPGARPRSTTRVCVGTWSPSRLDPCHRPLSMVPFELVVTPGDLGEQLQIVAIADVAERDDGVPAQPARLVTRDVQPGVLVHELASVGAEP